MPYITEINLGDFVRACAELEADAEALLEIAKLLGLTPADAATAADEESKSSVEEAPIFGTGVDSSAESPQAVPEPSADVTRDVLAESGTDDGDTIPGRLIKLPSAHPTSLHVPTLSVQQSSGPSPELEALFHPRETRAILSKSLARATPSGPWDFDQVVERCARGEPLATVPQLEQSSLSCGVQLLVDRSEVMMVYAQDQARIRKIITRLVGENKTEVLGFSGFPSVAGAGAAFEWEPYDNQMPPLGTVVALLSDLGIGRPAWPNATATANQWRQFCGRLNRRNCPVVAFVPYGPSRWSQELKDSGIALIHWDRPTSISAVHAAVGSGLRIEV